jgi:branched-chain amino acid transport system permease protein
MTFWFAQFFAGLTSAAILFLISAGLSIVFGVTKIVNFAHGAFLMIGAYIGYVLIDRYGATPVGFWLCVLAAACATALLGAFFEMTLLRRLYRAPELFQLLGTFAAAMVIQDVLLKCFGGEELVGSRAPGLETSAHLFGIAFPFYDIVVILIAPMVLGVTWLILHRTHWGILVRAATHDREMVGALGTNQAWLFTGVFFLGCFLAGFAGALQVPRDAINLDMGMRAISDAFAVVVIGGLGSLTGAFVASIIIGELHAFGVALFPQLTLVLTFLLMALTLILRPHGLFGKPDPMSKPHEFSSEPPLRPTSRFGLLVSAAAWLVLALAPLFLGAYRTGLLSEAIIYIMFAASLFFIMGPGGLISFGHACYFGLGAYAVALLVHDWHISTLPALAAAILAGGVGALIFGWVCQRVSGVYFAMLTLAFGQIVWSISFQWYAVTGGDNGIVGIWPDLFQGKPVLFYYFVLALGTGSLLLLHKAIHAPFGYTLRTARDSVLRAQSLGIDVARYRWFAFILSGAIAGLAGGLFAFQKGSVFPGSIDVTRSIDATVMVLLGGIHSIAGPIVGAAAFFGLQSEIMRHTDLWRAVLGGTIILIVLFLPSGLTGAFARLFRAKEPR